MKKFSIILLLMSLIFPQISNNAFLTTESIAMVGSNIAQNGSYEGIFNNPARLADIDKFDLSVGGGNIYGFSWLPSYYFSMNAPIPVLGKIGIGFQQLKTKNGSTVLSTEQKLSIGYGLDLQRDNNSQLSIGFVGNSIQWDLGSSAGTNGDGSNGIELSSQSVITLDIGLLATLRDKYRCGVYINNINSAAVGSGMSRTILPRRLNAGINYIPISNLSTSISMERLLGDTDVQMKGGLQYSINSVIDVMMGVQSNPNRFGFGTKIKLIDQSIAYGLITHPVLPITHQISIGLGF